MGAARSLILWVVGLAYYAACVVVTLLLTFVASPRAFDPLLKAAMRGVFRIIFVRVRVAGAENVPADAPVIFCPSPHSSLLDVPLCAGHFPGFVRGVYAAGQDRWPLYGRLMRRLGNIPIERGDVHTSITTMMGAGSVFETGASLVIFPEGHRTLTGEMLPFKKLPFHFAKAARRPIVPVAVRGMWDVNNKTSWQIRPGTVEVVFGEAVQVSDVEALSPMELRDRVHARVRGLMEESGPAS